MPTFQASHFKRRARGFTLIELLIVVAIIAMLAGVLFPIFASQREKSRRSSCQSNLKQIGLGMMQYCRDYDENFPRPSSENPRVVWQQILQPYIKSVAVFVCPSNVAANESPVARAWGPHPMIPRSYGLNPRVSYSDRRVAITDNKSPARKIMVAESRAAWPDFGSASWKRDKWQQGFAGHLGTANYLFCDGHVMSHPVTYTAAPFNMWGGMDGGVCHTRSINCDTPEPTIIKALQELQSKS